MGGMAEDLIADIEVRYSGGPRIRAELRWDAAAAPVLAAAGGVRVGQDDPAAGAGGARDTGFGQDRVSRADVARGGPLALAAAARGRVSGAGLRAVSAPDGGRERGLRIAAAGRAPSASGGWRSCSSCSA